MDFDKIQQEGFDVRSFYNRLTNILCSYINNYVYDEFLDIYYRMIYNIIYGFSNREFISEQDLYNQFNFAHQQIKEVYLILKLNYLKKHNINKDIFINTSTDLNTYYNNLKGLDKSLKRNKTILK